MKFDALSWQMSPLDSQPCPSFERSTARIDTKLVGSLHRHCRLFRSKPLRYEKACPTEVRLRRVRPHRPISPTHPDAELVGEGQGNRQLELDTVTQSIFRRNESSQHVIVGSIEPHLRQISGIGAHPYTWDHLEIDRCPQTKRLPRVLFGYTQHRCRNGRHAIGEGVGDLSAAEGLHVLAKHVVANKGCDPVSWPPQPIVANVHGPVSDAIVYVRHSI